MYKMLDLGVFVSVCAHAMQVGKKTPGVAVIQEHTHGRRRRHQPQKKQVLKHCCKAQTPLIVFDMFTVTIHWHCGGAI